MPSTEEDTSSTSSSGAPAGSSWTYILSESARLTIMRGIERYGDLINNYLERASLRFIFDIYDIAALIYVESSFVERAYRPERIGYEWALRYRSRYPVIEEWDDPNAWGSYGLMQVLPVTAMELNLIPRDITSISEYLFEVSNNIYCGLKILKKKYELSGNNKFNAIRLYNGSLDNPRTYDYALKITNYAEQIRG